MYGTGGSLVKFIYCAKMGETHRALTVVDDRFLKSAIILDDFRTTYVTQKLVRSCSWSDVCCVAVFRNFTGFPMFLKPYEILQFVNWEGRHATQVQRTQKYYYVCQLQWKGAYVPTVAR